MIHSLERRFLVFLLIPVTIVVVVAGVTGFLFARTYLRDQWIATVQLQLDKASHQISMKLEEKLRLINLISKAEGIPNQDITQAFLIQQLAQLDGVRFVNIEPLEVQDGNSSQSSTGSDDLASGSDEGLYTMEVCSDFGFCAPTLDPASTDRSLRIVKVLGDDGLTPLRRLTVRIRFDSFMDALTQIGLEEGGAACLVTSTGQFLAHTDKLKSDRRKLGDNGDEFETKVLEEMRHNSFGTVVGKGHPPDMVAGFHKIGAINWYLIVFSRGDVAMRPIVQFREYYLLAGIAALAVIVLLIRVTTRSVGRAVGAMSAAAAKVRQGDYTVKLPLDRTDEIGALNRSFNDLVEGLQRRDLIEQTFGRYVDKKVAEELMSKPEALRLGGEKRIVTMMMSDLRNFTGIAEKLAPEEVIKMLNRYFGRMVAVIERHRGIVVDFYGDSILVFFNGIESDTADRALDAVRCALEMQREHETFLRENTTQGLPPILMGIGIHTGEVVVGNIGTESRAKYGIVGSDVNLTDRIQSAAAGGKVVISEKTYECLADRITISQEFQVCLKGVEDDKNLYEVESVEAEPLPTGSVPLQTNDKRPDPQTPIYRQG